MKHNTFLVKPASSLCNLRCRYCFYDDVSNSRACKNMGLLSHEMAGELVEKAFAATEEGGSVHFLFQGGEPTLAGLDFFRFFLETERSMQRNISVFHSIQTNGICLDEEWASFFKANSFLVGLSLDGTQENHDLYRLDAAGQGTWDKVTHALALLDAYRVETNLLCVVTGQLARKPQRAFKSLCELGQHNLQFIPCLDPLDTIGGQAYSLTPELYGRFLCGIFDVWYQQLQQGHYISIRNFEDYLRILLGMPPTSCASSGSCGHYLAVEGDGSLYPCDFYVLDEWKLGEIKHCTVEQALNSPTSQMFLAQGHKRPAECAAVLTGCSAGVAASATGMPPEATDSAQHTNIFSPMLFHVCKPLRVFSHNRTDKEILPKAFMASGRIFILPSESSGWSVHHRGWASSHKCNSGHHIRRWKSSP